MSELTVSETFRMAGDWYAQAEALLDENHVVAVCGDEAMKIRFGSHVAVQAEQQKHVEVALIFGRFVRDLEGLAYMLSRSMPMDEPIEPTIVGITGALREHLPLTRRRYVVWHDADVMAEAAPDDFWRAADALMGVASEQEFSEEDRLVISRAMFVGGEGLLASPAFGAWWSEGEVEPLWQVVSGLATPPVCAVRVEGGAGG